MSSYKQDQDFVSSIIGTDLLENAIDWIAKNMNPEDVFSTSDLETWAEENKYSKNTD